MIIPGLTVRVFRQLTTPPTAIDIVILLIATPALKMGLPNPGSGSWILIACLLLIVLPSPAAAFGAGNIPSIAQVEGLNFRHGGKPGAFCQAVENLTDVATDIEDMLKTVAFIRGHKWTSMMIKRVYFGNW